MARSSLANAQSIADPAQSWNFDLFLPSVPGSSDTHSLTYKCMTTGLPGSSLDRVTVPLHGVELVYAGRRTYTHSFASTFLEASDWSTRDQFITWQELARSWISNTGSVKSVYSVTGQIVTYDDAPNVARTMYVYGLWPEEVAQVEMDGGASNFVQLSITWSFDYISS